MIREGLLLPAVRAGTAAFEGMSICPCDTMLPVAPLTVLL